MGKVFIRDIREAAKGSLPPVLGVSTQGAVDTSGIVTADGRPLLLWRHEMARGSEIRFDAPVSGHVVYVMSGIARADGTKVFPGGALVVEHNASVTISAESDRVVVLDFHRRDTDTGAKSGGHFHVVPLLSPEGENVSTGMQNAFFADSNCPSCSLWLNRVDYPGSFQGVPHVHNADELMVVIGGELRIGTRTHHPGTAIAIDENVVYSVGGGDEGVSLINFRSTDPGYIAVTSEGRKPMVLERSALRSLPPPRSPRWCVGAAEIAL